MDKNHRLNVANKMSVVFPNSVEVSHGLIPIMAVPYKIIEYIFLTLYQM